MVECRECGQNAENQAIRIDGNASVIDQEDWDRGRVKS